MYGWVITEGTSTVLLIKDILEVINNTGVLAGNK